ncbi:disrupted in schizophrenia 1 protein isoform X3 [Gasterosteus aculeatus]
MGSSAFLCSLAEAHSATNGMWRLNPRARRRACVISQGGRASGTAGCSARKRLHRRPGDPRGEQSRPHSTTHGQEEEEDEEDEKEEEEEEEERTTCIKNGTSGRHGDIFGATNARIEQHPNKLKCSSWESLLSSVSHHLPHVDYGASNGASSHRGPSSSPQKELGLSPAVRSSPEDSFNSSFSFIRQSLNSSQRTDATSAPPSWQPEPLCPSTGALGPPMTKPAASSVGQNVSQQSAPVQSLAPCSRGGPEETCLGGRFWRERAWEVTGDLADSDSPGVNIEITSTLSVDSDTASASSVTSGYESAAPASDRCWENLVKKYDGVLQHCLQNNRAHAKIEAVTVKLQGLQQKAILDDDYDAAERFGTKLEDLYRERGALKLGLPSRQPSVEVFLERLRRVVHSVLQRADCAQCRETSGPDAKERSDSSRGSLQRRDCLIREKRMVEEEMEELQRRLTELKERSRCLGQRIQQEEQQVEAEELEGSVLRSCTVAQLRDLSRTLQDLVASESRAQISVSPPPSLLRLQQQQQELNLSIKEVTAKVVMSQRLGSSLRRKASETETQLLALHEAKLAAISGNDFSSAKELKAEMKAVFLERDRLDALAKRLHSLSWGSSQELGRMKEQRQQLREELEQREAQHESRLEENTTKYVKLLEDRLHSCGCPGLERIWDADLEACHLFLRGLQLRTPRCSGGDVEDPPAAAVHPPTRPCTKEEEEEDCAMLTALGGRWCPEANLQNSEFTKKLEEFLFCMEENHAEDGCSETAALTERCELISDRLLTLEDELQTAVLNRDCVLTHILSLFSKYTVCYLCVFLSLSIHLQDLVSSRSLHSKKSTQPNYL